jgi:8-hydroxy-5-deazaflavin:NADPH oxidoreductase
MKHRRWFLAGLGTLALARLGSKVRAAEGVPQETFAVLGTGKVGGAIGGRLAGLGYPVVYGSRTPESERVKALLKVAGAHARATSHAAAISAGAVVMLALPWEPVRELLSGTCTHVRIASSRFIHGTCQHPYGCR